MNFAQAISTCLNKYVDFSGRARRSEYWFFYLFTTIVNGAANFIFGAGSWAASIISLLLFLPGLSVAFRRLHDVGKSGGWCFFTLVPLVGAIMVLIWYCTDSQPGSNRYGENPKH